MCGESLMSEHIPRCCRHDVRPCLATASWCNWTKNINDLKLFLVDLSQYIGFRKEKKINKKWDRNFITRAKKALTLHSQRMPQNWIPLISYHYRPQGKEQLEDRRNDDESSCNSEEGTDQKVQSLMLLMTLMTKHESLLHEICSPSPQPHSPKKRGLLHWGVLPSVKIRPVETGYNNTPCSRRWLVPYKN